MPSTNFIPKSGLGALSDAKVVWVAIRPSACRQEKAPERAELSEPKIVHFVMAITSAEFVFRHAHIEAPGLPGKIKGRVVMIEALAFTLVVVALGLPALIIAPFSVVRTLNEWNRNTSAVHPTGRAARLLCAS